MKNAICLNAESITQKYEVYHEMQVSFDIF